MAQLLRGAPVAAAAAALLTRECELLRERGVIPGLAVVRVGAREDDLAYERAALRRCAAVGVEARSEVLPPDAGQAALLALIRRLNGDDAVHGVLLLRPLPAGLDEAAVCAALLPEKDVDGITPGSMAFVFSGTGTGFPPCTARACVEILKHYDIPLAGARVTVLGRSLVIGRPVSLLLQRENATVTMCHTRTRDLSSECRRAELLVAAVGRAGAVGADCFSPGQTVLDVGIHASADGTLCGDVDFSAAEPVVRAITPVPDGVGPVTTAVLAAHVIEAAKRRMGQNGDFRAL